MRWMARIGVVGILVVGLTGCTLVSVDQDAAQEWLTSVSLEREGNTELMGSVGALTSPDDASPRRDGEGITLTLGTPGSVSVVELLCFGSDRVAVDIRVKTETLGKAVRAEIPCDEMAHRVELGEGGESLVGVTSVSIDGRSSTITTYYADVYP